MRACLCAVVVAACGPAPQPPAAPAPPPAPPPASAPAPAAERYTVVPVDTAHGLSGLAAEGSALWTLAERAATAYRITLDAALRPTVEAFPIEGLEAGFDLEGIAMLGPGRFALGTEGRLDGVATVLLAERRGAALAVTRTIQLPESSVGLPLAQNHGAEGVCGAGDTVIVSIETAGEGTGGDAGRRWAPIVRLDLARGGTAIARTHRLWLTSKTGKISGLDCTVAPDGSAAVWAIERHFEVTRFLRFTVPPAGAGPAATDLTPEIALDLPEVAGRDNLEGIAALPGGVLAAVVDNQWKTITGPSRLLIFPRGAAR